MAAGLRWVVVVGLLAAGSASAQFGNRSVGASVGYVNLINRSDLKWAVPIGLFYTAYLENGLEVIARINGAVVAHDIAGTLAFATSGGLGARKLLLEEQIRPYVALELSYFGTMFPGIESFYVGGTGALGVDVMITGEVSIGARGQYTVFPVLNGTWVHALEATGTVAAHF